MTTATTRLAIRRALYDRIPGLGFNATATAVSGVTLTDAVSFLDTTQGQNAYRGFYLYRPARTGADRVHKIVTVASTTGIVTTTGSSYSNTADLDYEVIGLLHPDELNACITRAQRRMYFETQVPLSMVDDGDMDSSGVTSWTSVGTPATKSKTTTGARVFSGIRALHVLNDATGEGVQSVTLSGFPPTATDWCYVSAYVQADVGTAELHLWNVTAGTSIASVTSSQEGWTHLWLHWQIPTGCEEIAVRMLGTENNADLYWNHLVVYRLNTRRLAAPSWLDEQHKFLKLREARFAHVVNSQTYGGQDDAMSRYFSDWTQPGEYSLDPFHLETNPYCIQANRTLPRNELWIEGKRPYSDLEALAADTDTTLAPLDLVYAYCGEEVAKILKKRYPTDKRWDTLMTEAVADRDAQTSSRPEIPMTPARREHWGRV